MRKTKRDVQELFQPGRVKQLFTIDYMSKEQLEAEWGVTWMPEGYYKHLSISMFSRLPSWEEVKFFRDKYFDKNEFVMKVLPREDKYINIHQYCFHLFGYIGLTKED